MQFSAAISQPPGSKARHTVELSVFTASGGQAVLIPSQVSSTSQTPCEGRQTNPPGRNGVAWAGSPDPVQNSAGSQPAGRVTAIKGVRPLYVGRTVEIGTVAEFRQVAGTRRGTTLGAVTDKRSSTAAAEPEHVPQLAGPPAWQFVPVGFEGIGWTAY